MESNCNKTSWDKVARRELMSLASATTSLKVTCHRFEKQYTEMALRVLFFSLVHKQVEEQLQHFIPNKPNVHHNLLAKPG